VAWDGCLSSVNPPGLTCLCSLPGTPERREDGAVGAEARGEAVLVLHGVHELECLIHGLEHVGEDTARVGGGGGAVEGGAVSGGEEVDELVVLVSGEAGNGVGVSIDDGHRGGCSRLGFARGRGWGPLNMAGGRGLRRARGLRRSRAVGSRRAGGRRERRWGLRARGIARWQNKECGRLH
jgi:hypothetical protein